VEVGIPKFEILAPPPASPPSPDASPCAGSTGRRHWAERAAEQEPAPRTTCRGKQITGGPTSALVTCLSNNGSVHLAYNPFFQLVFSAETVFFSHNKSANNIFRPAY
jgi:hypothetical protein